MANSQVIAFSRPRRVKTSLPSAQSIRNLTRPTRVNGQFFEGRCLC
jgi:hypothetical protein